jgi:hypothetical protein
LYGFCSYARVDKDLADYVLLIHKELGGVANGYKTLPELIHFTKKFFVNNQSLGSKILGNLYKFNSETTAAICEIPFIENTIKADDTNEQHDLSKLTFLVLNILT